MLNCWMVMKSHSSAVSLLHACAILLVAPLWKASALAQCLARGQPPMLMVRNVSLSPAA
ncbi:MAG: hypothetical protein GX174_08660 [Lentisphaerae bacterium]|jgi:hypothetical protein|nr:hypothetical protein [Lentisphaerota bacterium]